LVHEQGVGHEFTGVPVLGFVVAV
jgi:hypothetical protein